MALRVAVLAPISWRVPPRHYGPWEQFASTLSEGLVQRGVDVTLFASGDSLTTARLSATTTTAWAEAASGSFDPKVEECLHISSLFERASDFDVIHNSFDFLPLSYSRLVETPVLTTIHGFSSELIVAVYEKYNESGGYVAISEADRHPRLDYLATIYHGIDTATFQLGDGGGGYLLFFGRIHRDKGTVQAIEVARLFGLPLIIAGIIADEQYFADEVTPLIDGTEIRYIGPVGAEKRPEVLGGAVALLHMINFDEPFGFSVVEAMACGTPVVATRRGSMPELVDDGVSGYVVDGVEAAVEALGRVSSLDRSAIRHRAVTRFGSERMIDEYIGAYDALLSNASQLGDGRP